MKFREYYAENYSPNVPSRTVAAGHVIGARNYDCPNLFFPQSSLNVVVTVDDAKVRDMKI